MAQAHRRSRSTNAGQRGGRIILAPARYTAQAEPTAVRTTLVVGQRCATCPTCGYQVRVITAQWSDPARDIRHLDSVLTEHTPDGTKVLANRVTHIKPTPCVSSHTRVRKDAITLHKEEA